MSVINCVGLIRPNAATVQYEATEVETYAIARANFIVNFMRTFQIQILSTIVDFCSNQCSIMYSQIYIYIYIYISF